MHTVPSILSHEKVPLSGLSEELRKVLGFSSPDVTSTIDVLVMNHPPSD